MYAKRIHWESEIPAYRVGGNEFRSAVPESLLGAWEEVLREDGLYPEPSQHEGSYREPEADEFYSIAADAAEVWDRFPSDFRGLVMACFRMRDREAEALSAEPLSRAPEHFGRVPVGRGKSLRDPMVPREAHLRAGPHTASLEWQRAHKARDTMAMETLPDVEPISAKEREVHQALLDAMEVAAQEARRDDHLASSAALIG